MKGDWKETGIERRWGLPGIDIIVCFYNTDREERRNDDVMREKSERIIA